MGVKHFSHYRNSQAAAGMWEVVSPALFEVYFKFPNLFDNNNTWDGYQQLLLEHVRSISGLDGVTPTIGNIVQKYKFAERHYAAAGPDKTSLELTITFTMNLNNSHENYIYNMLRKWYDYVYNPQNGQTLTKKEYADGSSMTIIEHDRDGSIYREINCFNFFPSTPPTGLNDDNYDSMGDAKTVSITFLVDDWVERSVGMPQYRDINSGAIDDTLYIKPTSPTTIGGNVYI